MITLFVATMLLIGSALLIGVLVTLLTCLPGWLVIIAVVALDIFVLRKIFKKK